MNWKRANIEICKGIVDKDDVRAQTIENGMTLVIPEPHYYAYFFTEENIAFAVEKIQKLPQKSKIVNLGVVEPENEIKMTDDFRLIPYKRGIARRFDKDGKNVWLNNEYLKNLDVYACRFYQTKGKGKDAVIATEHGTPAMMILPLLMDD